MKTKSVALQAWLPGVLALLIAALTPTITFAADPDLRPVSFILATNAVVYYPTFPNSPTLTVAWGVTNQGNGVAAGFWYDYVYVSTNAVLDTEDTIVWAAGEVGPVAVSGEYARTNTVQLPQQSGTYWLIFKTDA